MKKIISYGLLILVFTLIFTGMTSAVQAQTDPTILLKIAKHAQDQLQSQINQDTSDKIEHSFF